MRVDTAPVAVVIVAWNAERYLVDCLDSLRRLERRPAEIVVVDNASGDDTTELVRRDYPEAAAKEGSLPLENGAITSSRTTSIFRLSPEGLPWRVY